MNFLKDSEPVSRGRIMLNSLNTLPSKQRSIIQILDEHGELTPAEIVEKMDTGSYKNKDNAIRSVNNILKRLVEEGFVLRNRRGKSYQYSLSDKIKTLMVNA